eukprot:m.160286 g.160286  ORF g.160286 m.160286 type:complete len:521 (-) comp11924_c0_seq1:387-1949(-)
MIRTSLATELGVTMAEGQPTHNRQPQPSSMGTEEPNFDNMLAHVLAMTGDVDLGRQFAFDDSMFGPNSGMDILDKLGIETMDMSMASLAVPDGTPRLPSGGSAASGGGSVRGFGQQQQQQPPSMLPFYDASMPSLSSPGVDDDNFLLPPWNGQAASFPSYNPLDSSSQQSANTGAFLPPTHAPPQPHHHHHQQQQQQQQQHLWQPMGNLSSFPSATGGGLASGSGATSHGGQMTGPPRTQHAGGWAGIAGKRGAGNKKGSRLSRFGSYHGTGIEEQHIDAFGDLSDLTGGGHARKQRQNSGSKEKKRRPLSRGRKDKLGNCVCCDATSTPLWREGKNGCRLCNACGIRWVKYGIACDSCKYVPRKSEASKELCPRCSAPFPPADEDAIRRRSQPVSGASLTASSGSVAATGISSPLATSTGPIQPSFSDDSDYARLPAMQSRAQDPGDSGSGDAGLATATAAVYSEDGMPPQPHVPWRGLMPSGPRGSHDGPPRAQQHVSPFGFARGGLQGGHLSRSFTR